MKRAWLGIRKPDVVTVEVVDTLETLVTLTYEMEAKLSALEKKEAK